MRAIILWLLVLPLLADTPVKLGKIEVSAKDRTLTFPAKINQDGEIAEFLLVHKTGKVHEALWSTEVSAIELAAAMALLGLEVDKENVKEVPSGVENVATLPGVKIFVSNDKKAWKPVTDYIHYKGESAPLAEHPWHYAGSYFWEDKFMAQVEGDFIAIFTSVNALILMEHAERTDDTRWFSSTSELGKKGDPVFLRLIVPAQEK